MHSIIRFSCEKIGGPPYCPCEKPIFNERSLIAYLINKCIITFQFLDTINKYRLPGSVQVASHYEGWELPFEDSNRYPLIVSKYFHIINPEPSLFQVQQHLNISQSVSVCDLC